MDVVRFLAFSFVLASHYLPHASEQWSHVFPAHYAKICATAVAGCSQGLNLFFTLSAYLIVELLLREREATGTVGVQQFYLRRVLRIWPLYFTGLAIALAFALHNNEKDTVAWVGWSFVMLGNWFLMFHNILRTPMAVLWTISVEEQFYSFAPWMVRRLSQLWLVVFASLLIVIANVFLFLAGVFPEAKFNPWPNSFIQFENFACGILLCIFVRRHSIRLSVWHRLMFLFGAILCWSLSLFGDIEVPGSALINGALEMGGFALTSLACCFLLLAVHQIESRFLPQALIYLGRISYGLYVFHGLAWRTALRSRVDKSLLGLAISDMIALALTFVLAALSYRFLETPFLRLKKRHEIIESRPI